MPTSTITGTIIDGAGTPVAGVAVYARLRPYNGTRLTDGSTVTNPPSTTTNGSGIYTFALEQQANIVPAGSWWEIEEDTSDPAGGRKVRTISVGASAATVTQSEVTPLALLGPTALTQAQGDSRYLAVGAGDGRYLTLADAIGASLVWNQKLGYNTLPVVTGDHVTQHGVQNIAIGSNAGAFTTDGSWNIFVGPDAGWQNTTGRENVFMGIQAGLACTTGIDNTGVGTGALNGGNLATGSPLPALTGDYNSAFGVTAGAQVSTGSDNVFAGNNAGMSPGQAHPTKAGNQNTLVGRYTGASAGDPNYTTALGANVSVAGDGSVAIGCDHTGAGAAATGTDTFVLGTANHKPIIPAMSIAGTGLGDGFAIRPNGPASDAGALHVLNTGGLKIFDGGGTARSTLTSGTGTPTAAAADGDYYLRTDTPGTPNQRLYARAGGVWAGIL